MIASELREAFDLRRAFEALNSFFAPFFFVIIGLAVSVGDPIATARIVPRSPSSPRWESSEESPSRPGRSVGPPRCGSGPD